MSVCAVRSLFNVIITYMLIILKNQIIRKVLKRKLNAYKVLLISLDFLYAQA